MASFIRHQTNKGVVWEARARAPGRAPVSKRFPKRSEAERWARETEALMRSGKAPEKAPEPEADSRSRTVGAAVAGYLRDHPAMSPSTRAKMASVAHDLGMVRVGEVTFEFVQRYVRLLERTPVPPPKGKKGGSPRASKDGRVRLYAGSTVRKAFFALRSALVYDSRVHGWTLPEGTFDTREHSLPGCWDKPRERRLAPGEEEALLAACREGASGFEFERLVVLALATGARLQEIALARREDLRHGGKGLWVPPERCKTRRGRVLPLSSVARAVLASLASGSGASGPLFPSFERDKAAVSKLFIRATRRAGIANLTFHDLRHEAISRMCERGTLSLMDLMKISGHSDVRTLERYVVLMPDDLAAKLG